MVMMNPDLVAGDIEITRAQNRNYARHSNSWSLLLRYQAQAERHGAPSGPRAAEEFERLKARREELPNEPIFEAQPEQTETTCTPSETNPSPPENPNSAPGPSASVSELKLDLAGAPCVLEDREVEARHPGSAPVPRIECRAVEGQGRRLPQHRGTEAPLADRRPEAADRCAERSLRINALFRHYPRCSCRGARAYIRCLCYSLLTPAITEFLTPITPLAPVFHGHAARTVI